MDPYSKELSLELTKTKLELENTSKELAETTNLLSEYIRGDIQNKTIIQQLNATIQRQSRSIRNYKKKLQIKQLPFFKKLKAIVLL